MIHRPFRGKILYSLLAILVLVACVPLLISGWQLVRINQKVLKSNWRELQSHLATALSDQITAYVTSQQARIDKMATTFSLYIQKFGFDGLKHQLQDETLLTRSIDQQILLLKLSGGSSTEPWAAASRLKQVFPQLQEELFRAKKIAGQGEPYRSLPVLLEGLAEPLLVLSHPLKIGKKVHGSLLSVLSLQPIGELLSERSRGIFSIYLLDETDRLFCHSDHEPPFSGLNLEENGLVREYLEGGHRQVAATIPFKLRGEKRERAMIGTFLRLRELGWTVFLHIQRDEAYYSVRQMYWSTLVWGLVAIGIALIVGYIFARRISHPIHTLAGITQSMAQGDYSRRAEITREDEIGDLADSFNHMASEIELAIQKLKNASEENRQLFMGTIKTLSAAIDAKDPYTKGHSERVTHYSVIIAQELGLSQEEIERLRISALLHDIGKIGIHDRVLTKTGKLTDEEFDLMKQHPEKGAQIMAPIEQLRDMIPGMRYHHEQWAGGGYPLGVSGEHIPQQGRIIAVADTFDAMTTTRPYQRAMSPEFAIAKINQLSGERFDPRIVKAASNAFRKGRLRPPKVDSQEPEDIAQQA